MAATRYDFDWADLAFGSKKAVRDLNAIFIAAPREISEKRFKQLVKTYLSQGNIVLGLSKEPFVEGFEDQPQFRMLEAKKMRKIIDLVNRSASLYHIYTLQYFQRELPFLIEKLGFKRVALIRGSWRQVFHTSPSYYMLTQKGITYTMVSPFVDEAEAKEYAGRTAVLDQHWADDYVHDHLSDKGMIDLAAKIAKFSYDYGFQTGASLGRREGQGAKPYKVIDAAYNMVVPYSTYAMHFGNSREDNLSPPNDLNHYDTIHAEVMLILSAQRNKLNLKGSSLFINLMPCPTCARMLSQTEIEEFVYSIDHSDGYAVKMLEAAGKKVRRVVP